MKTRNLTPFLGSLALRAQGDLGPLSSYSRQNKIVWFLKAWLRDPASPRQIAHRNRLRACAASWNATTPATRTDYERVTQKLSLYLNGYNLWISMSMNPQAREAMPTIRRQSGIDIPMPPEN